LIGCGIKIKLGKFHQGINYPWYSFFTKAYPPLEEKQKQYYGIVKEGCPGLGGTGLRNPYRLK